MKPIFNLLLPVLLLVCGLHHSSCRAQLQGDAKSEENRTGDSLDEKHLSSEIRLVPFDNNIPYKLAENLSNEQWQPSNNDDDDLSTKSTAENTCVPMFNLTNYLNVTPPSHSNSEANFSFAIGDIDLPVSLSNSSFSAAIKFLSSFSSQLEPDNEQEQRENFVRFRENRLHITGPNLTMLNMHLFADSDPKFGIGITIKNTTLTGQFSYNGPLALTDSKLAGYYRMSIDSVFLTASSNLTKRIDNSVRGRENKRYNLRTSDFKMNISNLGYISIDIFDSRDSNRPTSNYLLKMLNRLLQRTIKRTYYTFETYIREALESESRRSLDCELTRFSPLLDNRGASNHQSDLGRILSNEILRSQLNFVPLPNYEHQQAVLGTNAIIQLYNGSLTGLESIRLNGETRVKLQDEHLFVNTSVGWTELKPHYNWNLLIGNSKTPISKGFVSFNIKGVSGLS